MPALTIASASHIQLHNHQHVYASLRQSSAMAAGLEAIATTAIDAGEATPDQLDHIAYLAAHLCNHLGQLEAGIAEAAAKALR